MSGRGKSMSEQQVIFEAPERLIVIGDLNGDDEGLACMLRALEVTNANESWDPRGNVHLVQVGDIVNRGAGARNAMDRLMRLSAEARELGRGRVSVLLGNHEAMVTLGNLAWCCPEEILSFAAPTERAIYESKRGKHIYELLGAATSRAGTEPIYGKLRAWEEAHAPGREAYLDALGPSGLYGKWIRSLPLAIRVGEVLLTHGGLSYEYASMGLQELEITRRSFWEDTPLREADLAPGGFMFDDAGPLWNRRFSLGDGPDVQDELHTVLQELQSVTMVVGHTRTEQMPGGVRGLPHARFAGRFISVDVGIGHSGGTLSALVVEGEDLYAWRVEDPRVDLGRLLGPVEHEVTDQVSLPR